MTEAEHKSFVEFTKDPPFVGTFQYNQRGDGGNWNSIGTAMFYLTIENLAVDNLRLIWHLMITT